MVDDRSQYTIAISRNYSRNWELHFHYQVLMLSWPIAIPDCLVGIQSIHCGGVKVAALTCSHCHAQAYSTEAHSSHYSGHKLLISNWAAEWLKVFTCPSVYNQPTGCKYSHKLRVLLNYKTLINTEEDWWLKSCLCNPRWNQTDVFCWVRGGESGMVLREQ